MLIQSAHGRGIESTEIDVLVREDGVAVTQAVQGLVHVFADLGGRHLGTEGIGSSSTV